MTAHRRWTRRSDDRAIMASRLAPAADSAEADRYWRTRIRIESVKFVLWVLVQILKEALTLRWL
ncbi:hypothetical protein ACQEU6_35800 [Spirillospora sp. CA-108201]